MSKSLQFWALFSVILAVVWTEACESGDDPDIASDCHTREVNTNQGSDVCCYIELKKTNGGEVVTEKDCGNMNKAGIRTLKDDQEKQERVRDKNFSIVTIDCSSSFLSLGFLVILGLFF